ncbi:MAG: crossover junction endodeoxyribonuclease RuvC [bacterium]
MIVLGIDPGSHATGYGIVATGSSLRLLTSGVIRTRSRDPLPERLRTIHESIQGVLDGQAVDEMAVESLFNARNARSALILGHARGVILLAGALRFLPVAEYAPREIKSALTGNGGASKEQVRFMVCRYLGIRGEPPALDESDALAVALCHATRGQNPQLRQAGR